MWLRALVLSSLLFFAGGTTQGGFVDLAQEFPNSSQDFYKISGRTIPEIKAELKQKGPKDLFGNQRDAFTRWNISWKWPVEKGVPQYSRTVVSLALKFTLPEKTMKLSPQDEVKFDAYMNAMKKHEMHHAVGAVAIRKKVEDELRKLADTTSATKANKIAETILDELRAYDINYDQTTHHGLVEGVHLD